MPVVSTTKDRPLCPAGPHLLKLMDVESKLMPGFETTVESENWIWQFHTKKVAEDGSPYEVTVFTRTHYGPARAKLTWLLDMMVPGITPEQAEGLDTDALIGQSFKAQIKHSKGIKDPTRTFAEVVFLEPLTPPAGAKPAAKKAEAEVEDDFADPFAEA
ncbi:MAG: hypothetical protein H0U60_12330 [Blastocatellia bacterium]|nr:hypothetical protein [Blastocatellia bacterium]